MVGTRGIFRRNVWWANRYGVLSVGVPGLAIPLELPVTGYIQLVPGERFGFLRLGRLKRRGRHTEVPRAIEQQGRLRNVI